MSRRYNGQDLFDVADAAEAAGHPLTERTDLATNPAISPRPLCAASTYLERHRVGVDGYAIHDQAGPAWRFCSAKCAMVWSGRQDRRPGRVVSFHSRGKAS
jgi:hypothetical protein